MMTRHEIIRAEPSLVVDVIVGKVTAASLVKRTANALDAGTPETIVHWQTQSRGARSIADDAARLLMFRRRAETTFVYTATMDGLYRFTNTPQLPFGDVA